ncbi:bacteriohemerythrin [Melioribacteraceae bacterium 4301-Me]|uniref:bacteriohemerythrin n=1 Tax=Pyranulibacter aquaticus TaxID=3163344 RepID=UPI003599186B
MAFIQWDEKYSVNVKTLDNQHKRLVELINTLHDSMKLGKGKELLSYVLDELVNYTVYHFQSEERLFEKYNYPDSLTHKFQHDELVRKVQKIKRDYDAGVTVLPMEVLDFLKDWLVSHIMGTDKKYKTFFNTAGIS